MTPNKTAALDGHPGGQGKVVPPNSNPDDILRAAGFEPPRRYVRGGWVRIKAPGDKNGRRSGSVKLLSDGEGIIFGSHRGGWEKTVRFFGDGAKLSPAEAEARRRKVEAEQREMAKREATRHERAGRRALALWNQAQPATGDHAYLRRKGVQPHGTRVADDGRLLVPMSDADGKLWNLERIAPKKPADGSTDKKGLYQGRRTGCFYMIGDPNGAEVLCIGEGLATGASIREATGHPVAVAFNAGNLLPAAEALRRKFPHVRMVLCADDDYMTEGNPGLTKAEAAARAVGALVAVPDFGPDRPEKATDFNDLHQHAGLDPVRMCIDNAAAPAAADSGPTEAAAGDAADIVERAIEAAREAKRPGSLFAPNVARAILTLRAERPDAWADLRAEIKALRREGVDVSITALDRLTAAAGAEDEASATDIAIGIVKDRADLFHDEDKCAFATVQVADHAETYMVDGQGFRDWLAAEYYRGEERGLPEQAMAVAVSTARAMALFDGDERPAALRCAAIPGGYAIDMGDAAWRSIIVQAAGWEVVGAGPVRFYRTPDMRALPEPVRGGDVALLWKYANVPAKLRPLVLAWLLDSLRPDTAFPVLELCGVMGAAKSSTQRALRALVDPHSVPLRGRPKTVEDIFVSASANWMLSFENLSHLTGDMQDAFCAIATGAGFAARRLFTNSEESVIRAKRPIVVNGISANATQQDLIDRLIHVECPPVTERMTDAEWAEGFERDAPAILGALLDLFSAALRVLPTVEIAPAERPRMADFALLGEAMVRAMGGQPGDFLATYTGNRADSMMRVLDSSPVAAAVRTMVLERGGLIDFMTMKAAHAALAHYRPADADTAWPRSPKGLGDALRRYQPALALVGVEVTFHGIGREGSMVTIRRARPKPAAVKDGGGAGHIPSGGAIYRDQVHEVLDVHAEPAIREPGEHGGRGPMRESPEKVYIAPAGDLHAGRAGAVEVDL